MSNPRYKKADGSRCSHNGICLEMRESAAKTTAGQNRYWLGCPDCGRETGPFITVEAALRWELTRGRADGLPLIMRLERELEQKGLSIPWKASGEEALNE